MISLQSVTNSVIYHSNYILFSILFCNIRKVKLHRNDITDVMVLALISTACISNIIYSLQALLIYARISNAMEAEKQHFI